MVSTRRSSQSAGPDRAGSAEPAAAAPTTSGAGTSVNDATPSASKRGRAAASARRTTASSGRSTRRSGSQPPEEEQSQEPQQLETLQEEEDVPATQPVTGSQAEQTGPASQQVPAASPIPAPARTTKAASKAVAPSPGTMASAKQAAQKSVKAASTSQPPSQQQQKPASYGWDDVSSDEDDGSDEEGGGNLMSKLAASIKAALQAKTGADLSKQPKQQQQAAEAAAVDGEAAVSKAGEEEDLSGAKLRWRPEVELPAHAKKQPTRAVMQTEIQADKEKGLSKQLLLPARDPKTQSKVKKGDTSKPDTAGKKWYDLPAQKIDDDMKRELRLLRLRHTFDTKRFYKTFDNTKFPKYFAFGTVVEGPQDFYGGRLDRAQRRKTTLTEQLLADSDVTHSRKKRYTKLQDEATKYQKVKKRKTEQPREQRSKPKPKH